MALLSLPFLGLCVISLLLFHAVSSARWKRGVLGVASAVFVASHALPDSSEYSFVMVIGSLLPMLVFAGLGYGLLLVVRASTFTYYGTIIAVTASFFLIRHYDVVGQFVQSAGKPMTVGLAYIVFRILQVAMDYRNDQEMAFPRPGQYLYHLFAFYTFLSGPLLKFQDHEAQLHGLDSDKLTYAGAHTDYSRLITGIVKTALIGEYLSMGAARFLQWFLGASDSPLHCSLFLASGALLFFLSVYVNFSGYMDVVIGLAGLFCLRLPENFNSPLEARNVFDFWQRWHITLSFWFKEYLFTPVLVHFERAGLKGNLRVFCIGLLYFSTFFLLGMWHGPNLTFIIVGVCLGASATGNFIWQDALKSSLSRTTYRAVQQSRIYQGVAGGITLGCMVFSLLFWWIPRDNWIFFTTDGTITLLALSFFATFFIAIPLRAATQAASKAYGRICEWEMERLRTDGGGGIRLILYGKIMLLFCYFYFNRRELPAFVYQYF